jgi:PAS domain S-box-containing protein
MAWRSSLEKPVNAIRGGRIGKPIFRLLLSLAGMFVVTAALSEVSLRDRSLTAALTYLLVVIVSATWGFRYTLFVSFLAALGFSWMLPPVGRFFWLSDPRDVFALVAFLVIGIITSHLSRRARREEKRLRDLIETVPIMVFSIRPDGSNDFVSRNGQDYFGLSLEGITGGGWQATIHPDDHDTYLNQWHASLASGQPFENEVRHRSAKGEYRCFLVRAAPLRDEQGNILKWYGVMTDIEDRKRAEQARQEIEEQWKAAFESNPTMYFIVDVAGAIASVNNYGAEQLGYTVSELVGQPVLDVFYEPDRQSVQGHANACFEQPGRMMRWEARKIRKDGTMLWVRETGNAVTLKKRLVLLVICENITEQKRAEETARRSTKELRDAIEGIPAMVFVALPGPSHVFASQGWREYTGLSSEDTAGYGWQSAVHPEDMDRHMEKWRACTATGDPFEDEARFRRASDGEYRWFLVRAVSLRDEQGSLLKWYGVLTDIEERKRAEQERERLRQVEEDLARTNRVSMMGELAASLSHEINQPIAAAVLNAKACARWLQHKPPSLEEACEAASRLVKDVLRAADIVARNRSLYTRDASKREMVNLNVLIRQMIALLHDAANRQSISIRAELGKALPTVPADLVQIEQVLMNLMLNGIEAMKDTGGELVIRSEKAEDGQILLSVSDLGVGLPVENVERIFDAFFTTKAQGTGMGLSISRRIIESHGGHLWATANTGKGATFYFTLPTAARTEPRP